MTNNLENFGGLFIDPKEITTKTKSGKKNEETKL